MTREEAIEFGNMWLQINEYWKDNSTYAFFQIAINIMHKYQKIEQIIHDDWIKGVNSGATLNKIEEVFENEVNGDGNDT